MVFRRLLSIMLAGVISVSSVWGTAVTVNAASEEIVSGVEPVSDETDTIEDESEAMLDEEESDKAIDSASEDVSNSAEEGSSFDSDNNEDLGNETDDISNSGEDNREGDVAVAEDSEPNDPSIDDTPVEEEEKKIVNANYATSGRCGDGVFWALTGEDDLTLTISGSGEMYDYGSPAPPWEGQRSRITSVVIEQGVTKIGFGAFENCTNLTSVIIADSVNHIHDCTFMNCTSLSSITIPGSVNYIGAAAFRGCINLESIEIPYGVQILYHSMFEGCVKLQAVSIPGSVKEIEDWAFEGCIGLTDVELPNSLETIGRSVFYGCSGIGSIIIPKSVTKIDWYAFRDCTRLTSITIPSSVTYIEDGVFSGCVNLSSVSLPNTLTGIGEYAFSGCTYLKSLTIPNSVTEIKKGAFCANGLETVTIPQSVISIGEAAFINCENLSSAIILGPISCIESSMFFSCENLQSVTIPNSVDSIAANAFSEDENLESIDLPDSVTTIGERAFFHSGLKNIVLPSSLVTIGKDAFRYCYSLDSLTIPDKVTIIGQGAFASCSLSTMVLPVSVTSIEKCAFPHCSDVYYKGSRDMLKKVNIDFEEWDWEYGTYSGNLNLFKYGKIHYGISEAYDIEKKEYGIPGPYDTGTWEYGGKNTFRFSLSNENNKVEEAEYPFFIDLSNFFRVSSYYGDERLMHLLKMSMRVAMAAMDPNDYTRTGKSGTYIRDLMGKLDFQAGDIDIEYENPNGDSIGTAIASRQVKEGSNEITLVMVAVRGGGYKNEWAGNANVMNHDDYAGSINHYGFDLASDKVVSRIKDHLIKNRISKYSNVKIWISGYSRAAAVSNLTAAKLDDGAITGIDSQNIYAFCYECPKNTRATDWKNSKYNNIISVVNRVDLIPMVAPYCSTSGWKYHRYGKTLFINDGTQRQAKFSNDLVKMYDNYYNILGTDKSHDTKIARRDKQLWCYTNHNILVNNKTANLCSNYLLGHIIDTINNPKDYADRYQDKVYKEFMSKDDLSMDPWDALVTFLDVLIKAWPLLLTDALLVKDYVTINHYPELQLAWIDSFEKESDFLHLEELNSKDVIINCPVNVTVTDAYGNIAAQIINDEPVYIEGGIATFVDNDGQKIVRIPEDGNYKVEVSAYTDGEVTITTMEMEGDDISPQKIESYQQIDVKSNETIIATFDGDNTTFTDPDGNLLTPDISQNREEIVSMKVEAVSKGPGTVEGGGIFYAGEYCQVTANLDDGGSFTGWFVNGELVSKEATYRFAVMEDTIITGVFSEFVEGSFTVKYTDTVADPYEGISYNAKTARFETVYKGYAVMPKVSVVGGSGELKEGVDYTIKYSNNTNYDSKGKPATVTVTGKGNYAGKSVLNFYIMRADLAVAKEKGLLAIPDEIEVQSGKKANPVILYGSYKLKASDMDISNKAAIKENSSIDIVGKGNFTGKLEGIRVKVLTAEDVKNYMIKASVKPLKHIYNGTAQVLTHSAPGVPGELTVTAGTSKDPLVEGVDYTVTYKANVNAGTATVKIKAAGKYLGEESRTFQIQPDKTSDIAADLANPEADILFTAEGAKPSVAVTATRADGSKEILSEGKDYKVSYSNNKKVGTAKYTVSFLGNYKGHAAIKNKSFSISAAAFNKAKANSVDLIYTKPGKYLSAPLVSMGNVLLSSKDYTVKYFDGETDLTGNSKIALDSNANAKEITVKITGRGNYQAQEITTTYSVRRADSTTVDLSKAKIVAKDKNSKGKDVAIGKQEYTGRTVKPEIRVLIKNGKTWTEVLSENYTISYINNVNRGKATVIITGDGTNAVGSKKANFTIGTKNLGFFKWLFG